MKSKEELTAPKEEVETMNEKLHELTDEELAQVSGGVLSVANLHNIARPGDGNGPGMND